MTKFYTYILKNKIHNKHYYGHTSNLDKRLNDHNSGLSTFTKKYLPWALIYSEVFNTRAEAMNREKYFMSIAGYHWLKERNII